MGRSASGDFLRILWRANLQRDTVTRQYAPIFLGGIAEHTAVWTARNRYRTRRSWTDKPNGDPYPAHAEQKNGAEGTARSRHEIATNRARS